MGWLAWLKSGVPRPVQPLWPDGVPKLYPGVGDEEMCRFVSAEEVERIKQLPLVVLLPFARQGSPDNDTFLGFGLWRLMIRDLMLVRDISVCGPEDTPKVYAHMAVQIAARLRKRVVVTGWVRTGTDGWELHWQILNRSGASEGSVIDRDFRQFLHRCATELTSAVGGTVNEQTLQRWNTARPSKPESLRGLGAAHFSLKDGSAEQARALEKVWQSDPTFALPLSNSGRDNCDCTKQYVEAFKRDPYDAQLCFLLFCSLWQSKGSEPRAMQFIRRAIELSPGHGKAHMCAPHAAARGVSMLHHSELGYRLLPGNPFAINNYILNLKKAGASIEELLALAEEGIAADPNDPGNYGCMIEVFSKAERCDAALEIAYRLRQLYEPKINERALYCLKQNPVMAKAIESGQFDPVANHRRLIAELERKAGRR
jgi:TolB-like protein